MTIPEDKSRIPLHEEEPFEYIWRPNQVFVPNFVSRALRVEELKLNHPSYGEGYSWRLNEETDLIQMDLFPGNHLTIITLGPTDLTNYAMFVSILFAHGSKTEGGISVLKGKESKGSIARFNMYRNGGFEYGSEDLNSFLQDL